MEPAKDRQPIPFKERLVAVRAELFESDRHKLPRTEPSKDTQSSLYQRLSRGFVGILAVVLMGVFLLIFNDYLTTLVQMESLPGVVNLATKPHNATLFFGQSPMCGLEECYISPDYEPKDGKQVQLPTARLSDMPEFQTAVTSKRMYYRIPLEIPQTLLNSGEVLAFSPGWVNHDIRGARSQLKRDPRCHPPSQSFL